MVPRQGHAWKSQQCDSHLPLLQTKLGGGVREVVGGCQVCMQGAWASLHCIGVVYFWSLFLCLQLCGQSSEKSWGFFLDKKHPSFATTVRKHWCNAQISCWVNVHWWCVRAAESSRKNKTENACESLDTSFQPWRCISLSCLLCLLQLQILYSYSGLWKEGTGYTVFDVTEVWKTQRENNWLKMSQVDQFLEPAVSQQLTDRNTSHLLSVNQTSPEQCRGGCVTFSGHVTLGKMQTTLRHTKTGATVFEYDQLFSAGLLLSAVVAF